MTNVDFAISIAMIIFIISFAVFYVAMNFSNEMTIVENMELRKSSSELGAQLFSTSSGLQSDANKVEGIYTEIGGYQHKEQIKVSLEPEAVISTVHVYDNFMSEIQSDVSFQGNKVIISFWLDFSPSEKKQANIFYKGGTTTKIEYMSNSTETNVTGRIISEYEIPIISQDKCSEMKSMNYTEAKDKIGFEHQFKVELNDCSFGIEPPSTTVIVNSFPVLVENLNGSISPEIARIMVW